ncbi:MAG: DUF4280 domain-containing protein [Nakamurella sp.]
MPLPVVTGAMLACTFGMAPSTLNVIRPNVMDESRPQANITDAAPLVNVPPFGMCMSLANPMVAAATAAALGVLTPMPCVPALVGMWAPIAPTVLVAGAPALVQGSVLMCAYGGVISVAMPGTATTQIS